MINAQVASSTVSTRSAHVGADHSDDAHLSAYNAAFSDLGLRFRWDLATLDMLREFSGEAARITAFIERYHGHLHRAYDADFLAQMILQKKDKYYSEFAAAAE